MKKCLLLLLCLFGCSSSPEKKDLRPLVLVSVLPYVELVEAISGGAVNVKCVLPAYVDPHNWEPKHRDLANYETASLWFTIGEGFESPLLKKLKSIQPNLKTVSLAGPVKKLGSSCEHAECGFDTHFWLDPLTDIKQAEVIYNALAEKIPEKGQLFHENLLRLKEKLTTVDRALAKSLEPFRGKILVTSHGAYTYFCNRYGLIQFVIEPQEGKEPRPKDLTYLISNLKKDPNSILGVFTQPQHSNKAAKILAKALNLPLFSVDPYKKTYMETMVLLETDITSYAERN